MGAMVICAISFWLRGLSPCKYRRTNFWLTKQLLTSLQRVDVWTPCPYSIKDPMMKSWAITNLAFLNDH